MTNLKIQLSDGVKVIISQINKFGFEAFAVGGCVRDSLLGLTPHDWDVCTNAKPDEIKKCFKDFKVFDTGIKHGTVSVLYENSVFEVTTYRIDGEYADNRHPKNVEFTSDINRDLARRDFTVNAMAYNDETGIIDPYNGIADIKNKFIRCVGEPDKRFNEDALRILRGLRFASVYDFKIDKATSDSIMANADLLGSIANERINVELNKLLCGIGAESILNEYRDVFAVFIPEIRPMFDYDQRSKHHSRDLWRHTTYAVSTVKNTPLLRVTMLLHDIGKPNVRTTDDKGYCHFKNHQNVSVEIADKILHRLRYPANFIDDCLVLIKYHDVRFCGSKRQIKRLMNKIGVNNTRLLFDIQYADISAQSEYQQKQKLENIRIAKQQFEEIIKENECFSLSQLAVNGNDIKRIGITDGRQIGYILNYLMDKVIDNELENETNILLKAAKDFNNQIDKKEDFRKY